jgi:hypothetical protein
MTENKLFQEMLLKALNEETNVENICLITKNKLKDDFITLPNCEHKFNYDSLYKEVCKQKLESGHLETQKLSIWQIKCPYCRNTVQGILPYRCKIIPNKTRYVNWPWEHSFIKSFCKYEFCSGKKKGKICNKLCEKDYCNYHKKIVDNRKKKQEEKEKDKAENQNDITKMTVKELKNYCKIYGIKKYSNLRKKDILELIKTYQHKKHQKKQPQKKSEKGIQLYIKSVQQYNQIVSI